MPTCLVVESGLSGHSDALAISEVIPTGKGLPLQQPHDLNLNGIDCSSVDQCVVRGSHQVGDEVRGGQPQAALLQLARYPQAAQQQQHRGMVSILLLHSKRLLKHSPVHATHIGLASQESNDIDTMHA